MTNYLIDTNIAIFYMKGLFELKEKFRTIPLSNVYISEISLLELKFGIEKSKKKEKNIAALKGFLYGVQIIQISESIDLFAKEKASLQKLGTPINDFDLLIAVTAVTHNLIMVTNNTKHFKNVQQIKLEDWTNSSTT